MERTADTDIYTTLGTIILLIITIVGFAIKFTTLKNNIEYRMKTAEDVNCKQTTDIHSLKTKANNNDVIIMEIRTKLASIEALLMEMKEQIKNK